MLNEASEGKFDMKMVMISVSARLWIKDDSPPPVPVLIE